MITMDTLGSQREASAIVGLTTSSRSKDNQPRVAQAAKLPFEIIDAGVHRHTAARFMLHRDHGRIKAQHRVVLHDLRPIVGEHLQIWSQVKLFQHG
jgi:hypothetical protein